MPMNILNILDNDSILCILQKLSDSDKVKFVSCCKHLYNLKKSIRFDGYYYYDRMEKLGIVNQCRNLIRIVTDDNINQPITKNIKYLKLYTRQQFIKDKLPINIIGLEISRIFEQDIGPFIPDALEELILYDCDIPIKKFLPPTLRTLKFIHAHKNVIKDQITPNITNLMLGDYDGSLGKWLPNNLKYLDVGKSFRGRIGFNIPITVETLILGDLFNSSINNLRNNIRVLKLGNSFNKPINILPELLEELYIGRGFNSEIMYLPKRLTRLEFDSECIFDHPINVLPDSLKYLKLGCFFNQSIEKCLPNGLIRLEFGDYFNKPIKKKVFRGYRFKTKKFIPDSVRVLKFGMYFNKDINGGLPCNVTKIILGSHYTHAIRKIPTSAKHVQLEVGFRMASMQHWNNITHFKIYYTQYNYYKDVLPQHEVVNNKTKGLIGYKLIKIKN
ncbi:putative FNIP repeat-containing protein [Niemeyer virus]|uniref:FNIP repeat-containing protein n=1 Tax=Acanthamoeba polyphaga mimivirus Kroon TaxID=3069720 RepID=A0A0G2Y7V1_9VIRU|nr:putative FNIP repeat-containing protein [Acanthamoeba polyphaga mimivirus]AKI79902.1 putative FNIP repeat-containing protein [Acanthamoeba polyphaga mimivirus Kroon]ALR83735.1 putative FNIP repeat-containing protein [Niemeyer virus]